MGVFFSTILALGLVTTDTVQLKYELLTGSKPSYDVFQKAMIGYGHISERYTLNSEKKYLTIVDFNIPSSEKRLWIIDLASNQTLFHTYVAHGKNTGGLMAEHFSNTPHSNQSSLGFYITDQTYYGQNGYSLRLDGIEKGINDNARKRAVVMHGAWYAEQSFIDKHGRLGRSFGCPAVPASEHKEVIDLVKENTVLYLHDDSDLYLKKSQFMSSKPD